MMILTLFIIATLTFFLINAIPGKPLANAAKALPPEVQATFEKKYGLDQPVMVRYQKYITGLVTGDMGISIQYKGKEVTQIIKEQFPASLRLGIQSMIISTIIGIIFGIIAAFKRNKWQDHVIMFFSTLLISIPGLVAGLLLLLYFGGKGGLPTVGWYNSTQSFFQGFKYTILPSLALSLGAIASNARFMKSSVMDVMNQDYILTAQAKGLDRFKIVWRHIIRNSMVPMVTLLAPRFAAVITGSILIEKLFSIPGIGGELLGAITNRDYSVVMSLTVFFATIYIISLLIVDICYVLLDPRIRLSGSKG